VPPELHDVRPTLAQVELLVAARSRVRDLLQALGTA
jgi:hypothetical protein